jgi:fructose-1,6-bisphosphatase I
MGREQGKLRLLFECNPMGMIVTEAGGAVSTGKMNILEIQPTGVDNRVPIYVGGKKEIGLIENYFKG